MSSARAEMLALFRSLSPQEKYELGIGPAPGGQAASTPKIQGPCDALVAEADVAKVVQACRQGIKLAIDDPSATDDRTGHFLGQVNSALLAAAQANSLYRRKTLAHSLRAISEYLQSPASAERRAAAKLRVPPAAEASSSTAATADNTGSKGSK